MLELAVLGLLKERPMHGYELRKQLTQRLGLFWTVSFGSLYPTLKRLERRGVVARDEVRGEGRMRQVYRVTPPGEVLFLDLLCEGLDAGEQERFPLRMAFLGHVGPELRIRLLERRKRWLQDRLEAGSRSLRHLSAGADAYTTSLVRHGLDHTERDIAWLDDLLATERHRLVEERGSWPCAGGTPPEPPLYPSTQEMPTP